jgi:hypothetical protein
MNPQKGSTSAMKFRVEELLRKETSKFSVRLLNLMGVGRKVTKEDSQVSHTFFRGQR